ncbi:MAG: glycerophosphodiester phosphodiesterase [Chthonomonadales bacterium]|nr:glycerophosphodiester phosphodiesterase [Chthonomonadales bacterium]
MTLSGVITLLLVAASLMAAVAEAEAADVFEPSQADLDRVAAMLRTTMLPDAAAWRKIADRPDMREAVTRAEPYLTAPLPELTDDLYLDYSKTGNRRRCEAVIGERRGRLPALVIAECVEQRGRFIPALDALIRAICAEKSWVLPAHDGNLQTFTGELITIDLASSLLSWNLATAYRLLGDRLPAETRALIRSELDRRTFEPFRRMCAAKQSQAWLRVTNNWNSVCLAGVTGAALDALENARERAWFVLAAEHYSRYALQGFSPDGYCDEGVSYWNYGFGHYAALAETVRRATGGGIDLMKRKEVVMPSAYGFQIEIVPGICPAFADCPVNAAPHPGLVDYLSRRFTGKGTLDAPRSITGALADQVMAIFPDEAPVLRPETPWPKPDPLRSWFPDHSVLIGRPAAGSACRLSVAMMGGHNAQNHNHNDVGVFMAVVGNVAVLPDIGAEVYTRRTFSLQRYASKALNSWGHAVPVIAGKLQRAGRNAEAKVLQRDFTPERDRLVLDIRAAYDVPELERLERAFVYDRTGTGRFTVTDTFAFSQPGAYEMALLTFGTWKKLDERSLVVTDGGESARVSLETPEGATLEITASTVDEDLTARRTATRIGLKIVEPIASGKFSLTITPEPKPTADGRRHVAYVAHRGESHDAPENTMAAFRLAWERGVRTFELDTHLTADGHLVVCHDADTRRTAGVSHVIARTSLADLRKLDAGSWKGAQWKGEPLPTLADVLTAMPGESAVWIEVKCGPEAAGPLAAAIESAGLTPDRVNVISFNADALKAVRSLMPDVPMHLLSGFRRTDDNGWQPTVPQLIEQARVLGASALGVHFAGPIDRTSVEAVHAAGLRIGVWTIDDVRTARRMLAAGVDAITSNRAAWLREQLERDGT